MRMISFTCGAAALLGCSFVSTHAQVASGQSWIFSSSTLYRDTGQVATSTIATSMPAPPALATDRDDTGLIRGQAEGFPLERGLTDKADNPQDRNVRFRERGANCPVDDQAATDRLVARDQLAGRVVDLFDELELVLAFAERPSGSLIPESDLRQVARPCPGGARPERYLLVRVGGTPASEQDAAGLAEPVLQHRALADPSAKGS